MNVVVRVDEEHPLDERDAAEDDDRVEDGGAARLPAETAQDEEDAEGEQRVTGEVEEIGDRGVRRLAVQLHLVDGEDRVTRDLPEQPEREEVPGETLVPGQVPDRAEVDGDDRREPDADVVDRLGVRRQDEVDGDRDRTDGEEGPARRGLARARPVRAGSARAVGENEAMAVLSASE